MQTGGFDNGNQEMTGGKSCIPDSEKRRGQSCPYWGQISSARDNDRN